MILIKKLKLSKKVEVKRVIFSLIIGGYDTVPDVSHIKGWDKIMFTDINSLLKFKNRKKGWVFKKIDKSLINLENIEGFFPRGVEHYKNTLINRYYKLHPHLVLPKHYEESLYIDGSIKKFNIKEVENRIEFLKEQNKTFAVSSHAFRDNVHDEMEAIKQCNMLTEEGLQKIKNFFKEKNFPDKSGLYNNAIIWRKHKDTQVIQMMEEWWNLVRNYCMRDQVSLPYVIWKFNYKIEPLFANGLSAENHPSISYDYRHSGFFAKNKGKKFKFKLFNLK